MNTCPSYCPSSAQLERSQELRKQLPYCCNFAPNKRYGSIYVDKTREIYYLIADNQPKCLFRPLLFGKSGIVSVIQEIFEHGTAGYDGHESYFRGMAIYDLWQEKPGQHPVLLLDLSVGVHSCLESGAVFRHYLCDQLKLAAAHINIKVNATEDSFREIFESLFRAYSNPSQTFVLLIDDYDYPLTHCKDQVRAELSAVLQDFISCLQDLQRRFRCIFITGITSCKDTSIFTAGNFIADYSYNSLTAGICGYTREEITKYFPEHLRYAASCLLHKEEEAVTASDTEELLNEIERWYGGYAFDLKASVRVFNPWSVLCFFLRSTPVLTDCWFDKNEDSDVLQEALLHGIFSPEQEYCLDAVHSLSWNSFVSPPSCEAIRPETELFQYGYLTLAAPADPRTGVKLTMPNMEIRRACGRKISERLNRLAGYRSCYGIVHAMDISSLHSAQEFASFFNAMVHLLPDDACSLRSEKGIGAFICAFLCGGMIDCRSCRQEPYSSPALVVDLQERRLMFALRYAPADAIEQVMHSLLDKACEQLKSCTCGNSADRTDVPLLRLALVYAADQRQFVLSRVVELT